MKSLIDKVTENLQLIEDKKERKGLSTADLVALTQAQALAALVEQLMMLRIVIINQPK